MDTEIREMPPHLSKRWVKKVTLKDFNTPEKITVIASLLRKMVHFGCRSNLVRKTAVGILHGYRIPAKEHLGEISAIRHWISYNIHYVFDMGELFQTPVRQLIDWKRGVSASDCDCASILFASLCKSIGYQTGLLLVDSKGMGMINHCMGLVKLPKWDEYYKGKWIGIELTKHNTNIGWIPPLTTKKIIIKVDGAKLPTVL